MFYFRSFYCYVSKITTMSNLLLILFVIIFISSTVFFILEFPFHSLLILILLTRFVRFVIAALMSLSAYSIISVIPGLVSGDWFFFLFVMSHIFLLLCMPVKIFIGCWTLWTLHCGVLDCVVFIECGTLFWFVLK